MLIKEKDIYKILTIFLLSHLIIWTIVPSVTNENLPLDVIEALAWGSDLKWGYNKHPPLSAWSVELFYLIFGNQDWAYYLLSQLFVILSFFIIFKFSENFFKKKSYSLISVLLLEGIYFYNFTTPEFNVNVCQLPFFTLTVYYFWKGIKNNTNISWLLFGVFAALGVLSKYLFIYLLVALDFYLIYLIIKKKIDLKFLSSLFSFVVILVPHIVWLFDNNFTTIFYALERTESIDQNFLEKHFLNSLIFLGKQIGILLPFFLMCFLIISKLIKKIIYTDEKFIFLFFITVLPVVLTFLTSLFMGIKIRTMWMTPFYLFIGIFFVYIFKNEIILKNLKNFAIVFIILFIFSPFTYSYISLKESNKRTDYPGKKISQTIQEKWDSNFKNEIVLVSGDEWFAGNLSYHLKGRPKWDNILEENSKISFKDINGGFIITVGDDNNDIIALSSICNGLFFKLENQGFCLVGLKK